MYYRSARYPSELNAEYDEDFLAVDTHRDVHIAPAAVAFAAASFHRSRRIPRNISLPSRLPQGRACLLAEPLTPPSLTATEQHGGYTESLTDSSYQPPRDTHQVPQQSLVAPSWTRTSIPVPFSGW